MPSLLVMLLLLCSITFVQLAAYAQVLGNAPVPVNGAAFVRSQTKLFIQGGVVTALGNTVAQQNQMFALDLAVPWNSNSPVWISLKQGPTQGFHTAAMSTDEQTFVTFRTTAASTNNSALSYRFHVGSNVWDQSSVRVQYPGKDGISAVQDPLSGLVYLAGGYQSDDLQMYVYNIDTDTITMFPMPHNYMLDRAHYSGLYLKSRKSILYFGGVTSGGQPSMDQITEFIPSTGAWSTLTTYNQNPPHRADFCMVSNDDGTRVVVFGGRMDNGDFAGDLWILDVPSLTWTQGPSWPEPRISTACTIAGSIFLAWGGSNGQRTVDSSMILYDINQGQYITSYMPPLEYINNMHMNATLNSASDSNGRVGSQRNSGHGSASDKDGSSQDERMKSSSLLIVGGIIGSAFIIACVSLLSVFIHRHRQKIQNQCVGFSNNDTSSHNTLQPRFSNSYGRSIASSSLAAFPISDEKPL